MANLEQFRIELLTEDRLQKAFEKTRDDIIIPGVKLVRLTEEHYDTAAEFMMETFMKDEPLNISVKAGEENRTEVVELWKMLFQRNLSLMLLDDASGEIIGIRCTTIRSSADEKVYDIKDTGLRKIFNYIKYCNQKANIFDHLGVNELIRFMALSVSSKYRRRGFASQLMKAAILYVHNMGFETVCFQGEGTSNFSKNIYETNGFEILYESFYDAYKINGEQVFCNTGEHKSVKVYVKRINSD